LNSFQEEFLRRIKKQASLPSEKAVLIFFGLLAQRSGEDASDQRMFDVADLPTVAA
jgi:hypothetical protein